MVHLFKEASTLWLTEAVGKSKPPVRTQFGNWRICCLGEYGYMVMLSRICGVGGLDSNLHLKIYRERERMERREKEEERGRKDYNYIYLFSKHLDSSFI